MAKRPAASERAAAWRAEVTAWVAELERRFQLTRVDLAHKAQISPTTLYRWFNVRLAHTPEHSSILKIAAAFGVDPPAIGGAPARGFAEEGAIPIAPPEQEAALTPNQSWWRVADRALELEGFLVGDRVLLDQAERAQPGEAVIAQIYDFDRGAAETRLRWHEPPFLLTRSHDPAFAGRPLYIDGKRVAVMGPIVRMVRDRR